MELASLVISIVALGVSCYFSYRPFKDRRNALRHKLILYKEMFDRMVREWESHQEWFNKLDDEKEDKYIHFYISLPVDFFESYPITDQDLDILSSLGFYGHGFGVDENKSMSYVKIKYMISNFLLENDKGKGTLLYEFISLPLTKHYINQNQISDFRLVRFFSTILGDAILKL